MKYLLFALPLLLAMKCETTAIGSQSELSGEWVVQEVFLGDVIDTPCGFEVQNAPPLTINFSAETNDEKRFSFSGESAINNFFGTYEVTSFNKTTGVGTVTLGPVGATKKGGPEELMACESRFFDLLNRTTDFNVSEENGKKVLRLGVFKKDDKPSRDGGTFLILERPE